MARLEAHSDDIRADIQDLRRDVSGVRKDVDGLKRFQAWMFGLGAGLGATATLLLNGVKDWWRH